MKARRYNVSFETECCTLILRAGRATPEDVTLPEGAFYLLPRLKTIADDQTLALDLLEASVATVPGSAFGVPGHLRLSFATDEATLVAGCQRLVKAVEARS